MGKTKATSYLRKADVIISSLCEDNTKKDCILVIKQLQKARGFMQKADKILLRQFAIKKISRLKGQNREETIGGIVKAYKLLHIWAGIQ